MDNYLEAYQELPEKLAEQYRELHFDNHCYLRIALDNVLRAKWDTKVKRPAYKNLSKDELDTVLQFLRAYQQDKALLLQHNTQSLEYRRAWKATTGKFTS